MSKEKINVEEVVIDGQTYVPKGQQPVVVKDYCIVRTYSAGVHAGEIIERNGKEVKMKNARRLWYWSGAASLSQLAVDGVSNPSSCKFPCEVPVKTLTEAIEIIPCTQAAINSIKGVAIWKK